MSEKPKTTFENINDLLKAIFWPVIVLLIFFTYKTDIGKIIGLIPRKLENSSKISVGSLSFEIEKTAKITGNEDLGEIIKNLSERGIRRLLTLGIGSYSIMVRTEPNAYNNFDKTYALPQDFNVLLELEKNGLLKADEPLNDFLSFFQKLKPTEKKINMSNGTDTTENKFVELSISVSKLTPEEITRIDNFGVELSVAGKNAFDIIVHVISEQINKN